MAYENKTDAFIQPVQAGGGSLGSKILIEESNMREKHTEKFTLKNQIIPTLIPIETASISERSNDKTFSNSSETKLNTKISNHYFKKIIYNKNININKINYKNEKDQNNSNSDVFSSNYKNTT